MDLQGWIALAILGASALLFYKRWLPLEITALSIPVLLLLTHVLTTREALSGFGNPAVIALGSMFVIGAGLQESGVTTLIARMLQRLAGHGETVLLFALMLTVACVSSVMSNQAVVAVFIPAVMTLSRRTLVAPSRLLIPLSFAAVLGGNLTLVGNQGNILVADVATQFGAELGMLEFAKVGVPIALMGILATVLVGRKLLPQRTEVQRLREALLPEEVAKSYGITKSLFHMRVLPQSSIVGKTIAESGIRAQYGLEVIAVVRPGTVRRQFLAPKPDLVLASGYELYVEGDDEAAWRFADYETVQFGLAGGHEIEDLLARGMTLAEVTFPPRSEAFGQTLKQLSFRRLHGLNVLALWRKAKAIRKDVADVPLELGDALLVAGPAENVRLLTRDADFIVLTDHSLDEDVSRAPAAFVLLLLAVVPPMFGLMRLEVSTLAAAVLMVATGCLDLTRVYRVIDWKVLFVVIGTLPLGIALEKTTVASVATSAVLALTARAGLVAVLAIIFVAAAALALITTTATAAVVCSPIAGQIALASGLPAHQAFLAVAYGASCAFILPNQPWNMLVMGPGGYVARDYLRVGAVVSIVVAVTAIVGLVLS